MVLEWEHTRTDRGRWKRSSVEGWGHVSCFTVSLQKLSVLYAFTQNLKPTTLFFVETAQPGKPRTLCREPVLRA